MIQSQTFRLPICYNAQTPKTGRSVANMNYTFGDLMCYTSPENGTKTKCVFIRGTGDSAFVMFKIANRITRVDYESLVKIA